MRNRYGYFFGNVGRRKSFWFFDCPFRRSLYATADRANGFRVRKFDLRTPATAYYGA